MTRRRKHRDREAYAREDRGLRAAPGLPRGGRRPRSTIVSKRRSLRNHWRSLEVLLGLGFAQHAAVEGRSCGRCDAMCARNMAFGRMSVWFATCGGLARRRRARVCEARVSGSSPVKKTFPAARGASSTTSATHPAAACSYSHRPRLTARCANLTKQYSDVDISGLDLSFDAKQVVFSMRHHER